METKKAEEVEFNEYINIWLGRRFLKITFEDGEPDADFDIEAIRELLNEETEEEPAC